MELKHTINGIEILEPIGFDGLKTTIKRHDYHGMSAEVSVGTLEFSGEAASIIHDAYNADIDTELNYVVTDEDGTVIYTGMIDLSTYDEHSGDYFTVSCKVGEVGVKTIFNNRTETEIDLNTDKTIDGNPIKVPIKWEDVAIPKKRLPHTNILEQKAERVFTPLTPMGANKGKHFISVSPADITVNEYGSVGGIERTMDCQLKKTDQYMYIPGDIIFSGDTSMKLFEEDSGFDEKFGTDTTHATIQINATIGVELCADILPTKDHYQGNVEGHQTGNKYYVATLALMQEDGTIIWTSKYGTAHIAPGSQMTVYTLNEDWDGEDFDDPMMNTETIENVPTNKRLFFGVLLETDWRFETYYEDAGGKHIISSDPLNNECTPTITVYQASIKMVMYDNLQNDSEKSKMALVHNVMNTTAHAISENALSIKSEWYGSPYSAINATSQCGGGSLKAITNGYNIRNILSKDMPISFKEIIKSLDAIDCIGWGFSTENGDIFVRVERWDWFYQNTHLFAINGAKEKQRKMDNGTVVTSIKVGYKKYTTSDEYNSIDAIHTERSFASHIKAVSKHVDKISAFIADIYAIEEARRARFEQDITKEFKHDENIFIFELVSKEKSGSKQLVIMNTASNIKGVDKEQFYNAKISPRHNLARMRDYLFTANHAEDITMISCKGNSLASFSVMGSDITESGVRYVSLLTNETNNPQKEDEALKYRRTKIKAEELIIKYPITFSQYKAIMANPYGIITVDGEECWLKEMTYSFFKDEAELKLIPKAN